MVTTGCVFVRGCFIADLMDAFRLVPLHPCERRFFVEEHKGKCLVYSTTRHKEAGVHRFHGQALQRSHRGESRASSFRTTRRRHAFTVWRHFIAHFLAVLFQGSSNAQNVMFGSGKFGLRSAGFICSFQKRRARFHAHIRGHTSTSLGVRSSFPQARCHTASAD